MADAMHRGFLVEVDGREIGRYSEVTGLQVQVETQTYSEGGVNDFVHQLPGRMTWPNIVLKRGLTKDDNLLKWFNDATGANFSKTNKVTRTSAEIILIDPKGKRLRSWTLIDAFPVKWTGPSIAIASSEYPTEELEVAHHGFKAQTFA